MFRVNNKDTRTTPLSLLLTLNIFHNFFQCFYCFSVSVVNFKHVYADWDDNMEFSRGNSKPRPESRINAIIRYSNVAIVSSKSTMDTPEQYEKSAQS